MSKQFRYFIVGIALVSIFFLFIWYCLSRSMDALNGIIIGVALLGSLFFEKTKNKINRISVIPAKAGISM